MQKTGTTSVGRFYKDFGFSYACWNADAKNNWSQKWYDGDYEAIFSSEDFRAVDAFEDSPWWMPGFYKVLYHRFPRSKFILFTRDSDAWFKSMINHNKGSTIGWGRVHCKAYGRISEYLDLLNTGRIEDRIENSLQYESKMKIIDHDEHYKKIYHLHATEVKDFFLRHDPKALFVGSLEDPDKWQKLGNFLEIDVPDNYECHLNATQRRCEIDSDNQING